MHQTFAYAQGPWLQHHSTLFLEENTTMTSESSDQWLVDYWLLLLLTSDYCYYWTIVTIELLK